MKTFKERTLQELRETLDKAITADDKSYRARDIVWQKFNLAHTRWRRLLLAEKAIAKRRRQEFYVCDRLKTKLFTMNIARGKYRFKLREALQDFEKKRDGGSY